MELLWTLMIFFFLLAPDVSLFVPVKLYLEEGIVIF